MKKSDPDDVIISKNEHEENKKSQNLHIEEDLNQCADHKELRKDKKYINNIDQILCYHDKSLPLHILVVVTFREKDCVFHILEVYKTLKPFNVKIFLEDRTYHDFQLFLKTSKNNELSFAEFTQYENDLHSKIIDIAITIGGDGIILKAASFFSNRSTPPMITFEKEIHGFLQNFKIGEIGTALTRIFNGIYKGGDIFVERRMRIFAKIVKKHINGAPDEELLSFSALNEIIVDRGPSPMCVKSEIYLNDNLITTNFGDGLIISTPTGSTAYAISASGPIIHNYVRSLNIVPICPHSLSFRPLVVPSDCIIKIKTSLESRANAFISSDGKRIFELSSNYELIISESVFDAYSKITQLLLFFTKLPFNYKSDD